MYLYDAELCSSLSICYELLSYLNLATNNSSTPTYNYSSNSTRPLLNSNILPVTWMYRYLLREASILKVQQLRSESLL
ncbi:Glycine dehydrogenase (decarboxylating) [Dirofilaria immitis]